MRGRLFWSLALVGALGWLVLGGSQAHAATFTLTHNGWTYSEDVSQQWQGSFIDPTGTNHMTQNGWWLRTNAMQSEVLLSSLVSGAGVELVGTNVAKLRFAQNGLFVEMIYTLTGISNKKGQVDIAWSVKSTGPSLGVDLFAYSNFDLNGTPLDDSGELINPNAIRYTDGNTAVDVIASTENLDGYDVAGYPSLLNLLMDSNVYNVSNSGLPFGPGDMTNVFQWHGNVVSGQPAMEGTLTKVVDLEYTPPPPGPVIPEPGTWALMLSGLAPVALRLRRKA